MAVQDGLTLEEVEAIWDDPKNAERSMLVRQTGEGTYLLAMPASDAIGHKSAEIDKEGIHRSLQRQKQSHKG